MDINCINIVYAVLKLSKGIPFKEIVVFALNETMFVIFEIHSDVIDPGLVYSC